MIFLDGLAPLAKTWLGMKKNRSGAVMTLRAVTYDFSREFPLQDIRGDAFQ